MRMMVESSSASVPVYTRQNQDKFACCSAPFCSGLYHTIVATAGTRKYLVVTVESQSQARLSGVSSFLLVESIPMNQPHCVWSHSTS